MPNGIFHNLLAEEYLKTSPRNVDIVAEKKKNFNDVLTAANNALDKKKFKIARDLYLELLKFIMDDPYPDELNLEEEIIYYINCCYCYSYCTYLEVGKSQESLDHLISTLEFLKVTFPNKMLPIYLQIIYNLAIESWVAIPEQCKALQNMEETKREIITNDMFKNLLPDVKNMMDTMHRANFLYYANTLKPISENVDEWSYKPDITAFKKSQRNRTMQTEESQKDSCQQTNEIKSTNKYVQTLGNKDSECQADFNEEYVQTLQDIKSKLHMVQQKCDYTVQTLNEKLSDIQVKLNEENLQNKSLRETYDKICTKYEKEIAELKKSLETYRKDSETENKNNSKLQKILLDLLQDKYNIRKAVSDSLIDKAYFMISYLGEILPSLTSSTIPDRVSVQKEIDYWHHQITVYTAYLSKLNDIYNSSKASIINSETLDFTKSWPDLLKFLKDGNNVIFNSFKPAIRRIIESEQRMTQYMNGVSLPSSHPINGQPLNIVPQVYYQRPFNHINYSVSQQQYQLLNVYQPSSSNAQYHVQKLKTPQSFSVNQTKTHKVDSSLPITSSTYTNNQEEKNESIISATLNIEPVMDVACSILGPPRKSDNSDENKKKSPETKNSEPSDLSSRSVDNAVNFCLLDLPNDTITNEISISEDDHNTMSSDELLFKYIFENCPDSTEQDITITLFEVLEDQGYKDIPKEEILKDVLKLLRCKANQHVKKMKNIQRTNKKLDESCTICFEDFKTAKTFSLPCQHIYHKHCIKRWLNKSNYCPICRHPCTLNIK